MFLSQLIKKWQNRKRAKSQITQEQKRLMAEYIRLRIEEEFYTVFGLPLNLK